MFNIHIPLSDGSGVVDIEPFDANDLGARPLGHKELVHYLTSPEREFHLTMTNLRVPTSQTGLAEDGPVRFEGRMTSNSKGPPLMGLLVGGWLPFPHASSEVVFVDRNVVSTLESHSAAELSPPTAGSGRHFEPRHAFELAGAHVSPLPYVLEGRHKRLPQLSDIRRSLVRAQAALRRVLPAKSVLSLTADQREGVLRMLGDMARYHPKNYAFLREVAGVNYPGRPATTILAGGGRGNLLMVRAS